MQTIEKLIAYKDQRPEVTWDEIARGIGVSKAVIHGLIADHKGEKVYGGNKPRNYKKIEAWLTLLQRRENAPEPVPFVKTSATHEVWSTLDYALIQRKMVSITGLSGRQKSWSVREWAMEHEDAVLVDSFASCNNVTFFHDLAQIVKVDPGQPVAMVIKSIISKLFHSNRMIIVDDAHYLAFKSMANLRYIHEQANIGTAFVGMPYLIDQMLGQRCRQWEQIYSRLAMRTELKDITEDDTRLIVHSVMPHADEKVVLQAFKFAGGSTSELVNFIQRVRAVAKGRKSPSVETINRVMVESAPVAETRVEPVEAG